ncbi:MAG: NAD-dependent epimerase/dehydratase family protein [Steroidobacteraceae bacterium]
MDKPTVLLTGISGFIARHCAVELLTAGYGVRGTLRSARRAGEVRESVARHAPVDRLEFAEADLLSDGGWDAAARGCAAVLHVASPFPTVQPRDEQDLIRPAVEGTLRVLRAARAAGAARFVQTSSLVAVMYGHPRARIEPFTAADWTVVDDPTVTAYGRSKTLAERAAREDVAREGGPHYSSVNPGLVLGPALDRDIGTSAEVVQAFLRGKYPGTPRLTMPCVDVRDVARMHRLALEADVPSGGRYLGSGGSISLLEMSLAIRAALGPAARRCPTRELPDWLVKIVAIFDGAARQAVPELGKRLEIDTTGTRRALGIEFIPSREAAVALARSLIELGLA